MIGRPLQAQVGLLVSYLLFELGDVHRLVAYASTVCTSRLVELVLELLTQVLRA